MPWPVGNSPWPPPSYRPVADQLGVNRAWWRGDPDQLRQVAEPSAGKRFWSRVRPSAGANDQGRQLHFPTTRKLSKKAADLVYGDGVTLQGTGDDEALGELLDRVGFASKLQQAGRVQAGLGGVFLRPTWRNVDGNGVPVLSVVQPTAALPVFDGDTLTEVIFWTKLGGSGRTVARLLERWTPGLLENRLYVGTVDTVGVPTRLETHPRTVDKPDTVELAKELAGRMLPEYLPFQLPGRLEDWPQVGAAVTEGPDIEGLMDALDETWTSLLRDVRLGQARIVAPVEFLTQLTSSDAGRRGAGKVFEVDREVFTPVDVPADQLEKMGIQQIQFSIRAEDHARTALGLLEEIVTTAGFAPASFGLDTAGKAESGTALRIREQASLRTRSELRLQAASCIARVAQSLAAIAAAMNSADVPTDEPTVRWPTDQALVDPLTEAQAVEVWARAGGMSLETIVRRAQPELDDAGVAEEVARVRADRGLVDDPTGVGDLV